MHDLAFIAGLTRENSDALGFIPLPDLEHRFVKRGRYLLQRDKGRRRVGFLIHGPVHVDGTVHIHQACIALDKRRRELGSAMVERFLRAAAEAGARKIIVRCAADLPALDFWRFHQAEPYSLEAGGKRRNRLIQVFRIAISSKSRPPRARCGPFACLHGP